MPDYTDSNQLPLRRSAGALKRRREPLRWPRGRDFRILALDGGGIRGVFPASLLAGLEEQYLDEQPLARYFDLIAGTSTGGIIALGLGAGLRAVDVQRMYVERGDTIFPPGRAGPVGAARRGMRWLSKWFRYRYDRTALDGLLGEVLGNRRLEESLTRLCIPSFDGRHGEVYVFKTPHHPDFKLDGVEYMRKVAAATAAAPTFFRPLRDGGYAFVDGGVWANNPVMVALVDALSCFDVARHRVSVLSLGCGTESFCLNRTQMVGGGILAWRHVIDAALSLQSAECTRAGWAPDRRGTAHADRRTDAGRRDRAGRLDASGHGTAKGGRTGPGGTRPRNCGHLHHGTGDAVSTVREHARVGLTGLDRRTEDRAPEVSATNTSAPAARHADSAGSTDPPRVRRVSGPAEGDACIRGGGRWPPGRVTRRAVAPRRRHARARLDADARRRWAPVPTSASHAWNALAELIPNPRRFGGEPKKGCQEGPLPVYAGTNITHRIVAQTGVNGVRLPRPQGRLCASLYFCTKQPTPCLATIT